MAEKELAEVSATMEREWGTDPRDPKQAPGLDVAEADTLYRREDLATDSHVFVAKGERIPREVIAPAAPRVRRNPSEAARKRSLPPSKD